MADDWMIVFVLVAGEVSFLCPGVLAGSLEQENPEFRFLAHLCRPEARVNFSNLVGGVVAILSVGLEPFFFCVSRRAVSLPVMASLRLSRRSLSCHPKRFIAYGDEFGPIYTDRCIPRQLVRRHTGSQA
jgi:hypothetical protein